MHTRVDLFYVSMLRPVNPRAGRAKTHPIHHIKIKKHRNLPMRTRTRGYLVTYDITIIMLLMLYAVMLKTFKKTLHLPM